MDYTKTVTMQSWQGVISAVVIFIFPTFFLQFLTTSGTVDDLAVHMFRLFAIFVIILCLTLLSVRGIKDRDMQKNVLISNMTFDCLGGCFFLFLALTGKLQLIGGCVLAGAMIVNGLSYLPALMKLARET